MLNSWNWKCSQRIIWLSNHSKDSQYFDKTNDLVFGKIKDEICSVTIKSFVGLKARKYKYITEDNHDCKDAKGINKNVVGHELKFDDYKNVLFNATYMKHEMNRMQSKIII